MKCQHFYSCSFSCTSFEAVVNWIEKGTLTGFTYVKQSHKKLFSNVIICSSWNANIHYLTSENGNLSKSSASNYLSSYVLWYIPSSRIQSGANSTYLPLNVYWRARHSLAIISKHCQWLVFQTQKLSFKIWTTFKSVADHVRIFCVFQVTSAGVRPLLPAEHDKLDNNYGSDDTDSDSPDTVASISSPPESECFHIIFYL